MVNLNIMNIEIIKTMKKIGLIVAFAIMASCGNNNNSAHQNTNVTQNDISIISKSIPVDEFKNKIETTPGTILDVRTPEEYSEGHLENAQLNNVKDNNFEKNLKAIPKDKPVYVYCRSGNRSKKAKATLEQSGYTEIYELDGGIIAWEKEGNQIVKD